MVASPSMMYALVARGKTVLAEYTFTSGNFPTITRVLLAKIPEDVDTKMSYQYDEYAFHYLVDRGITFLCMADQDFKRRVPFTFLDDIRNRWFSTYGDSGCTAIAFAMNEDFGGTLERQLEYFNANPNSDQIGQMQSKLEDVKNIMIDNIDQVLERGEKLEILVDRTDQLNQQAFVFQKQSTALKNKMFWKKVKTYCVVALGVVLLIYIILAVACGGLGLKDC